MHCAFDYEQLRFFLTIFDSWAIEIRRLAELVRSPVLFH